MRSLDDFCAPALKAKHKSSNRGIRFFRSIGRYFYQNTKNQGAI